jgi:integrase
MSKTVAETPMTTRSARRQLEAGLHWRGLDTEVHLGYRKAVKGGKWLVRWRVGKGYRQTPLGTADDVLEADGNETLSFDQARQAARDCVEAARLSAAVAAAGPIPTVRSAIEAYLIEREAREAAQRPGKTSKKDARSRLSRHVLSNQVIADKPLHEISEATLRAWRQSLSGLAATSVRRLGNDFKAALNLAAERNRTAAPTLPAILKAAFKSAPAPAVAREHQILDDGEVRSLIQAARKVDEAGEWDGDLYRLVLVLAATGARFSQIAGMRVGDIHRDRENARLMVPSSHKGKGIKRATRYAVAIGDDVLSALAPAIPGRGKAEPLLERWRLRQTSVTEWVKDRRGAWQSASEMLRPWRTIVKAAHLPDELVPYCLRHSSIVRGLRANLPVRLVASLHDTSTAMIEAHYGAYIIDAMSDASRLAVVPLADASGTNVPDAS